MAHQIFWSGSVPTLDDFGMAITSEFIDGATLYGPWGFMHPVSHKQHGRGLGMGKGQRYVKQSNGRWLKVEG